MMMQVKIYRLFWVVLLVISAFVLGYYLKPPRTTSPFMPGSGSKMMFRQAPPLSFPKNMPRHR